MRLLFRNFRNKNCCSNLLQITTSFLSKSQSGLSVLNTTIATKQNLEKSIIQDARPPLEKFSPLVEIFHISALSLAYFSLSCTSLTKGRSLILSPFLTSEANSHIQKYHWCCYYSHFMHNVSSPSGTFPSFPGAFQQKQI